MLAPLLRFFTSLRLTVALLAMGAVLVFWGTLAQVDLGLYKAQNEFFRSLFIYWHPGNGNAHVPIFPGGYLVGGLLLINLLVSHAKLYWRAFRAAIARLGSLVSGKQPRHTFENRKVGILLIHLGIILLILGQFATDMLSQESAMHIREGQSVNFSEAQRSFELAVMEPSDPQMNKVVAIPERMLAAGQDISHAELPFTIRTKTFFLNSTLSETNADGFSKVGAMDNLGARFFWRQLPHVTEMDDRDMPSGIVEIITPKGSLGTWFISSFLIHPQRLMVDGHPYELALRPARTYRPFSLHLIKFSFDRYPGTEIPKNFSSRVRLQRPETREDREVLIYMNSPLRYAGETFYQADWDKDDEKGTILQVVHNPGWLTPYLACILVAAGLVYQFLSHLIKFIDRRTA